MANCHTLALDYDIDQLGYWSTATQHYKHFKVSYWFVLCLSNYHIRGITPIDGSVANSVLDEVTLDSNRFIRLVSASHRLRF